MIDAHILQEVPLFQDIHGERLERLRASAEAESYAKGETVFRQGERARNMWVVLEGWVHLIRSPETGEAARSVVLFTITPDEALCGISAIEEKTYNLSAVAATTCRLLRIPTEILSDLLSYEPGFALRALHLCTRRIRHMAQQYGAMAEPVSHRIIRSILRLQDQFGSTIPVTHRELAQMSWTTTESAIRMVRRFKQRGYVTGTRGQLRIQQSKMLAALLSDSNGHSAV